MMHRPVGHAGDPGQREERLPPELLSASWRPDAEIQGVANELIGLAPKSLAAHLRGGRVAAIHDEGRPGLRAAADPKQLRIDIPAGWVDISDDRLREDNLVELVSRANAATGSLSTQCVAWPE